jgi:hypothetical protein
MGEGVGCGRRVRAGEGDGDGGGDARHTAVNGVFGGAGWVAPVSPRPQLHPSTWPPRTEVVAAPRPAHTQPPDPLPRQYPQKLG